jgi:hypothetical protein
MRKKEKKPSYRRVNGPAQRRAHAGGARFRPANGRSIGIAINVCVSIVRAWCGPFFLSAQYATRDTMVFFFLAMDTMVFFFYLFSCPVYTLLFLLLPPTHNTLR